MTNAVNTSISNQIYLSRDNIRTQIIEYLQTYLELKNVDLLKSSYLSFIVNILSTLTANILFYQISAYREFFLTTAQLPESILNLSAFLGYTAKEAGYSVSQVLVTIPFGFEDPVSTIIIPSGFGVYAGGTKFVTNYTTTITILNNQTATVLTESAESATYLPIKLNPTSFSFLLSVYQYVLSEQQFQIDQDLQPYQFVTIDVPLTGQVSTIDVQVQQPGSSSWKKYDPFSSLYLMSPTNQGFVSKKTNDGVTLYFGNGIIGIQPIPGSTIQVTAELTLGSSGDVIAGSITKGDRLYTTTSAGITKVLNYSVINPAPSTGGLDEESIDEVRTNAIASLTALKRLVSESDYKNSKVILESSPLGNNALPVLKRSDLKINEIQVYSTLFFGDSPVPTRNGEYIINSSVSYIPRNTIIEIDQIDYYTLFDMTIDYINKVAKYQYIMYQIEDAPLLVTTYGSTYNIIITKSVITKQNNTAEIELSYFSSELDSTSCECSISFLQSGKSYVMINDSVNKKFTYTFDPYTEIPEGNLTAYFTITRLGSSISQYSIDLTFRTSLDNFMMSNMVVGGDSTSFIDIGVDSTSSIIFDIPVIQKAYYDDIDKTIFESQVLQTILSGTDFKGIRMMTDFTNVKLANTTGILKNMQMNAVTKSSVIDINLEIVPSSVSLSDRYIVSGVEGGAWTGQQRGMIAECSDSLLNSWVFFSPVIDDILYVVNKGKKYIYAEGEWVVPEYQLPLQIELEIYKSRTYSFSDINLSTSIKDAIITAFQNRFGTNIAIYRSEIIDVVQRVNGVDHCRLVKPESSIFYTFDLDNLTQRELLEYGPEYIYFSSDNITIWIL